jgi:hypothetical protein
VQVQIHACDTALDVDVENEQRRIRSLDASNHAILARLQEAGTNCSEAFDRGRGN